MCCPLITEFTIGPQVLRQESDCYTYMMLVMIHIQQQITLCPEQTAEPQARVTFSRNHNGQAFNMLTSACTSQTSLLSGHTVLQCSSRCSGATAAKRAGACTIRSTGSHQHTVPQPCAPWRAKGPWLPPCIPAHNGYTEPSVLQGPQRPTAYQMYTSISVWLWVAQEDMTHLVLAVSSSATWTSCIIMYYYRSGCWWP